MQTLQTRHATVRAQQRGVPPFIMEWLLDYGHEQYDGHGGVRRYFTPKSIRQLEHDLGRDPIRRQWEYLRCYLVQCSTSGTVVTVGKRHPGRHMRRN